MGAEQNFVMRGEKTEMAQGFVTQKGVKTEMVQDFATEREEKMEMVQGCPMQTVGMVEEPVVQMVVMQAMAGAYQTFANCIKSGFTGVPK